MSNISRRTFLQSTVALAAAHRAVAAPNEKIRVAVIGCRNRGHQDAASFLAAGQFEIVALCDCDTAMLDVAMEELDGNFSTKPKLEQDFRRVLEDASIDAVINATPDHWHALLTVMALDAGKHVYLEKPASYNIYDTKLMLDAQRKHPDLVVQVGTQQRSGQHFIDARAFVEGGGLGKVGFARAWIAHTREPIERAPDSDPPPTLDYDLWVGPAPMCAYNKNFHHYNWHWLRDFGTGEMGNWGAHWIDVARWLAGLEMPVSVSGLGGQYVTKDDKQWPDTQTVLYRYPETTLLWEQRLWTKYGVNSKGGGVEIGGDRGTLTIDRGGWTFYPTEGPQEKHDRSDLEVAHAKNFADAIRGTAKPTAPIEVGGMSATLCHLGNIATLLNRTIAFDSATYSFPNDAEAQALVARPYRSPYVLNT